MKTSQLIIESIVGTVFPLLGAFVSSMDKIEFGMRMLSLCVGLGVGIASFIHIRQKTRYMREDRENKKDNERHSKTSHR